MKKAAPFVKGAFAVFKWSELEPANGQFDWKLFESTLGAYADAGLYMQLMVWVGPHSPEWIYSAGVPLVKTSPDVESARPAALHALPVLSG